MGLPMEVLFLTTLFSVVFAILFLLLFFSSRSKRGSCSDQDALIPFRDDKPEAPLLLPIRNQSKDDQR